MKRLLLAFALLYSSATYADVGDVYYCVTDNHTVVTESGTTQYSGTTQLPEEKFKFKWTEKEIIFSGGTFPRPDHRLNVIANYNTEYWTAKWWTDTVAHFYKGKLTYSVALGVPGVIKAVIATCDKF